jgi:hypothetical protein
MKNLVKHKRPRKSTGAVDNESNSEEKVKGKRKIWTDEETEALRQGMEQHGNDWVAIHRQYDILKDRHPVSLKDRARSMRRILTRAQKPLGVWANGCHP